MTSHNRKDDRGLLLTIMRGVCWFIDHEWLTFNMLSTPMRFCARCAELEEVRP